MHEPPLLLQDPVHRLAIHDEPVLESQQHPQPPIPKRGMLLDQLMEPLGPRRISSLLSCAGCARPMQAGTTDSQDPTTMSFRDIRSRGSHASDVFRSKG